MHRYRYLVDLAHKENVVDRVAVLPPGKPSESHLSRAASMYLELDVIWQDGETFVHRELK